jgi:hypothetical protein
MVQISSSTNDPDLLEHQHSRLWDFRPQDSEEPSVPLLPIPEIASPSRPDQRSIFPWDQRSRSSLSFRDFTTWADNSFRAPDSRLSSSQNHLSMVQISSSTNGPDLLEHQRSRFPHSFHDFTTLEKRLLAPDSRLLSSQKNLSVEDLLL